METFNKFLKLLIFIPFALIFLPSFLIVTTLNKTWSKMLDELFGM